MFYHIFIFHSCNGNVRTTMYPNLITLANKTRQCLNALVLVWSKQIMLMLLKYRLLSPPISMEKNAVSTGDKSCIATQ